jgi:hypothetical protein
MCDVCGHEMRRLSTESDQGSGEDWLCSWCYAMTILGADTRQVLRPECMPMHLRWEGVESAGPSFDVSQAYGYFKATLCGIRREDLIALPNFLRPNRANVCQACKDAAFVIYERWPLSMQEDSCEKVAPPPIRIGRTFR